MGTHIRISKMKFGLVLFMLFAAASALRLPARKIISFDDPPELSTWLQSRSRFHLTPRNAWTQYQLPKWKKSPKNNSLLPSKIVNFRMSNLLIREINNQH